ncbi:PepSY domain-containing protein [Aureisphaera galaxeae]|uniref:PepSY domain-containing protein n=1 Tax=Aureisphaera galaxeae TaxID=1538023 RepID=UPI00235004C5|nr:PepSY domain-containing protein [Aureisphaera galaxeae]MDC8004001.1 PepSY domain-containing protein [Aureisphaera galaxeae]
MAKPKFKFHRFNRRIHLYTGLFMIPYIFIFGLSGFLFNHPTALINRTSHSFKLENEESFAPLFPDIDALALSVTDSLIFDGVITSPDIKDIRYSSTMILRNFNDVADYRINADIPSSKVQLLTLPDFAENITVARGSYLFPSMLDSEALLTKAEELLVTQGITPGASRVQRIPNLVFDLSDANKNYRVSYNLTNGNYRIDDLDKRKFKINYLFTNLHEQHGYPVSGLSIRWLWVFFADTLAILMIVWAVSGLIMWFQMKRLLTIGTVLLAISGFIFILILLDNYELGF